MKRRLLGDALHLGGYRCAYCSRRLLDPLVVGLFAAGFQGTGLFPTHWQWKRTHPVVLPRFPALEHVWPLKRGGDPINTDNLAASCWQCNVTKSSSFVEELTDWDGPVVTRERDRFDGLVRLALTVSDSNPGVISSPERFLPAEGEVAEARPWPKPAATIRWLDYHHRGRRQRYGDLHRALADAAAVTGLPHLGVRLLLYAAPECKDGSMSGPVSTIDAPPTIADCGQPSAPCIELSDSREAFVGKFRVRRALPRKGRRTVGAWCFADHMGPADVTENSGLDVGPHPHIGLQTVTWLVDGEVLHRDSLGSEQVIKPGQLNLMTAGGAVAHAEEATGHYRGTLEGVQLWVALPEVTRHGPAAFEHHAELPQSELDGGVATVMIGELNGSLSPARHDTPLVGVDLTLGRLTTVPLRREFEYGVVVLEGALAITGTPLHPGKLGYLGAGRDELALDVREPTRALLIGGEPFGEPIVMWWNFVGRTREDIDAAYASWAAEDDRFGTVASALPRIPTKAPYWQQVPDSR